MTERGLSPMSINQLSLIIVAVGFSLAGWRVDPALGIGTGIIETGAIVRGFVAIRHLRRQGIIPGSGRELALVASSAGVLILIAGATTLALILPYACAVVGWRLMQEMILFLPSPLRSGTLTNPGERILFVPMLLFFYVSPILGLVLALVTLGKAAFHLLPLRTDPAARRWWGWKVASAWLVIVTTVGGLAEGTSWLEWNRLIRSSAAHAASVRQDERDATACLAHLDNLTRCPRCERPSRATILIRQVKAAEEAATLEAETAQLRADRAASWPERLMPAWLGVAASLMALRWVRPRPALDPVENPEKEG